MAPMSRHHAGSTSRVAWPSSQVAVVSSMACAGLRLRRAAPHPGRPCASAGDVQRACRQRHGGVLNERICSLIERGPRRLSHEPRPPICRRHSWLAYPRAGDIRGWLAVAIGSTHTKTRRAGRRPAVLPTAGVGTPCAKRNAGQSGAQQDRAGPSLTRPDQSSSSHSG